jgi:hypothetical protein
MSHLEDKVLCDWVGRPITLDSKAAELGVRPEELPKRLIASLFAHLPTPDPNSTDPNPKTVTLLTLLTDLGDIASQSITKLSGGMVLTAADRANLEGQLAKSLLQLYDELCSGGASILESYQAKVKGGPIGNLTLSELLKMSDQKPLIQQRGAFINLLFAHPFFTALKVLFRTPASGDTFTAIAKLRRTMSDLVIEDAFWEYSIFRHFLICSCAVVVGSRWVAMNMVANFVGRAVGCDPVIRLPEAPPAPTKKNPIPFAYTVAYESSGLSIDVVQNAKAGAEISANQGLILTFKASDGRRTKYYSKPFHLGQSKKQLTAAIKRSIEELMGGREIKLRRDILAQAWVTGKEDQYLSLLEPFTYIMLMHLGVAPKVIGLLDASSVGFFRFCTQEAVMEDALDRRPREETLDDRALILLFSYLFDLQDLKHLNVINWRWIIDFLVDCNVETEVPESATVDHILHLVGELQKDSQIDPLIPYNKSENVPLAQRLPDAIKTLRALIKNLPETPAVPLYCYTPIPELASAVNAPPAGLDWLFDPPREVSREWDPAFTAEDCINRFTLFVNRLAGGVIDFFFSPPPDGGRSRGELFGFRKTLPEVAAESVHFLEAQAVANLWHYCTVIIGRLMGLLAIPE